MDELSFRMGELFSGPGGMALGARNAAKKLDGVVLTHVWANDYDSDTCKTYKRNILEPEYGNDVHIVSSSRELPVSGGGIVHQNVHDLDIDALGDIEGFAFGFPCNDYSLVGEWKGLSGSFAPTPMSATFQGAISLISLLLLLRQSRLLYDATLIWHAVGNLT